MYQVSLRNPTLEINEKLLQHKNSDHLSKPATVVADVPTDHLTCIKGEGMNE
jgi:hypothetical protein